MFSLGRCAAGLAIIVAGTCTTAMNWRFSYQLGATEWDGYTWAVFSVALDVTKWLMLPCAALAWTHHKLRALAAVAIWLVATIYSFTAAMGFAAQNRDMTTWHRQQQAQNQKTLETMRLSSRWQSSAACADATSARSMEFCTTYRATEALFRSSPQEADPQAALLAKLTGLDIDKVRTVLSVFLAVACEVISALGFFAILTTEQGNRAQSQAPASRWKRPAWQAMPRRDAARPVATRPATSRRGQKRNAPGS
ncbi:MAG: hypothetical protein ABI612_21065 [Betaproteobacteria bacterium]